MAVGILVAKKSIKRKKEKDWIKKRLKYIIQLKDNKVYVYTLNKNLLDVKIKPEQIMFYFKYPNNENKENKTQPQN